MAESVHRLQKRKRLVKTDDFSSVFHLGKCNKGRFVAIHRHDSGNGFPRLGLAAPKKIARRAVDRNRFKRIVREVFRLQQDMLTTADYVVRLVSLKALQPENKLLLRTEISALLGSAGTC